MDRDQTHPGKEIDAVQRALKLRRSIVVLLINLAAVASLTVVSLDRTRVVAGYLGVGAAVAVLYFGVRFFGAPLASGSWEEKMISTGGLLTLGALIFVVVTQGTVFTPSLI